MPTIGGAAVGGLLTVPSRFKDFYPEPEYEQTIVHSGQIKKISGTFRHRQCERFNPGTLPFHNLMCSPCTTIGSSKKDSGLTQALRERHCGPSITTPLESLPHQELVQRYKDLQATNKRQGRDLVRVAKIQNKPVDLVAEVRAACDNEDVSGIIESLLKAHHAGKVNSEKHGTLLSILQQSCGNLNATSSKGHRNTCHTRAMKLYTAVLIKGGPRVANLLGLNLLGPMAPCVKKQWSDCTKYTYGIEGMREIMVSLREFYAAAMKTAGLNCAV